MTTLKYMNKYNKRANIAKERAVRGIVADSYAAELLNTNLEALSMKLDRSDATLTKEDMKALVDKNGMLDLSKVVNVLRTFSIVGYVCGSEVGKNTKGTDLSKTIAVGSDLKVFKAVSNKNVGNGNRYVTETGESPVFQEGVNVIKAETLMGFANVLYKVSYHELNRFIEILSRIDMSAVTEEDIAMIRRDMDIIGRALQEIAIDAAKDKSKAEGWAKIDEIIDFRVKMLMDMPTINNYDDIKRQLFAVKRDGTGTVDKYAMKLNCVLPKGAYTKDEFEALSPEEQLAAEESPIVVGMLGLAKLEVLESTNKVIADLVDTYTKTSMDRYDLYSSIALREQYIQTTTFIKRVYDVIRHSYDFEARIEENVMSDLRDAIYNETQTNPLFAGVKDKQHAIIKLAIAAGMMNLTTNKDGSITPTFNKESFRFGTVTRLFKDEFIAEYKNDVYSANTEVDVLLTLDKGNTVKFEDGEVYKFVSGVATMVYDESTKAMVPVDGVLATKETFTGIVRVNDGKLYARYETTTVNDKNVGCLIIKDWLNMDNTNEAESLDLNKITDEKALNMHKNALYNADSIHVTGANNNLLVAQFGNEYKLVARVRYTPGLLGESGEIKVKNILHYVTPVDPDKMNSTSQVSSMLTYVAK